MIILLVLCRRISVIIELFYEAAKCLTSVPVLLVQPVWLILTRTVFLLYWTVVYAYITTLGSFGLLHLIVTVYSRALFITLQRLMLDSLPPVPNASDGIKPVLHHLYQ